MFHEESLRNRSKETVLFLAAFEEFYNRAIRRPREFFADEFIFSKEGEIRAPVSDDYRNSVLSLSANVFEASLLWHVQAGVLSERDMAVAKRLKLYRNDVAHRPFHVLGGRFYKSWARNRAERMLKKLESYWIEVDVSTDPDIPDDYDRAEAISFFRIWYNHLEAALSK